MSLNFIISIAFLVLMFSGLFFTPSFAQYTGNTDSQPAPEPLSPDEEYEKIIREAMNKVIQYLSGQVQPPSIENFERLDQLTPKALELYDHDNITANIISPTSSNFCTILESPYLTNNDRAIFLEVCYEYLEWHDKFYRDVLTELNNALIKANIMINQMDISDEQKSVFISKASSDITKLNQTLLVQMEQLEKSESFLYRQSQTSHTKPIASFVDLEKDPTFYVQRYVTEPKYKDWFDTNYPEYEFWEAIGITQQKYQEIIADLNEMVTDNSVTISEKSHISCGTGTIYDPSTNMCIVDQTPQPSVTQQDTSSNIVDPEPDGDTISIEQQNSSVDEQINELMSPIWTKLSAKNERDFKILFHKAKAFAVFQYPLESYFYYSRAAEVNPNSDEAVNGKNMAYNNLKNYVIKLNEINQRLPSSLNQLSDLSEKGMSLYAIGDYNEALKYCGKALDICPDCVPQIECKLNSLLRLGKYDDAIDFAQTIRQSPPFTPDSTEAKMLSLYHKKQYDALLYFLDAKTKDVPIDSFAGVGASLLKAAVLEKMGKSDQANAILIASDIPTTDRNAINAGYGGVFFMLRDYHESVKYLEKVTKDNEKISYLKVIDYYEIERHSSQSEQTINGMKNYAAGQKNGCLIATAAFGTELAPQVQTLREIRDKVLFSTGSGTTFMIQFNEFYYAFSPTIADLERQSPLFKEAVKITITPMLSTLSILSHVNIDSEQEMLSYGIGIILLNIGMYFVAPALVIIKLNQRRHSKD